MSSPLALDPASPSTAMIARCPIAWLVSSTARVARRTSGKRLTSAFAVNRMSRPSASRLKTLSPETSAPSSPLVASSDEKVVAFCAIIIWFGRLGPPSRSKATSPAIRSTALALKSVFVPFRTVIHGSSPAEVGGAPSGFDSSTSECSLCQSSPGAR